MNQPSRPSYEFGPFSVDAGKMRLLNNGEPVPLTPKVLETLLALIEHRDRVLTKDELLKLVWGDTLVEEGGLARNISILRKALGEKPDDHEYVVTVPGRGYRFVAEVQERSGDISASGAPEPARAQTDSDRPRVSARRWVVLGGLAALTLALVVTYMLRPMAATGARRPPITSIAVLPLENLSGDPDQEYFADGVTDALINNLARIRALRVVSRTSVMRFKGTQPSLSEIARALHVDAVIDGAVQRTSDRVRISVQLIHAPTDTNLWARDYDGELTDVVRLQDEVARAVAGEIRTQVTAEERAWMASSGVVSPVAYQEYLLGQYYLWRLTEQDLSRAIDHFERATSLDPGYAAAYAGLSHAWWWRGIHGASTLKQVESTSHAAARKALELDPRLPEAHVSMGRIKYFRWDWAGAERDFGRALELDPNNLDAHFFHGMLYMALGRFPEAIAHIEKAEQLDPLSSTVQSAFGRILYRARRFDQAVSHLNQAIELEPRISGGYIRLMSVYLEMGKFEEALALWEKGSALHRASGSRVIPPGSNLARIYALMGKRDQAKPLLDAARQIDPPYELAQAYAALGDKDEAFRQLFRYLDEHDGLNYAKTDPPFDSLHSDPRWQIVLRRMNVSTESVDAGIPQQ
jgi:TolB-like protein/DNA-binding winged helix-turn-helix (wHTH) protein/Flp pilus assembly protein TadD